MRDKYHDYVTMFEVVDLGKNHGVLVALRASKLLKRSGFAAVKNGQIHMSTPPMLDVIQMDAVIDSKGWTG
jgi:hypothetical protein